jgi:hypothetical protein
LYDRIEGRREVGDNFGRPTQKGYVHSHTHANETSPTFHAQTDSYTQMLQFGSCCINAALEFSAPVKGEGGVGRGLGTRKGKACRVDHTLTSELVHLEI